ncbi:MAG: LPS export ABC transporter periplasmic protein LptC [Leptolyngbyaceae cyanobacterium]
MKRPYWWLAGAVALFLAIATGLRTCRDPGVRVEDSSGETADIVPGLTLRDVTLEQQDDDGGLLWKVDAEEVTYSSDQEVADLVRPEGELYQDGQLLYRVKADTGTIRENGQVIFLEGNIVATGEQNQMVIYGQNLEWRPEADVMIVRNGLTGNHPQIRAQANEARIYDVESRMELEGEVVATTVVADPQVDPWLKLQGETVLWQWDQETLASDRPLRIEQFENAKVTQVFAGQRGLVELSEDRVTLEESVQAQLLDVPMELTTDKAIWDVEAERVQAVSSVRVVEPEQQLTITSQQGEFDLAEQIAYFSRDVLALAAKNNGRLTSDRLRWNLEEQTVFAEGAVNYQQTDPQLNVRGPQARGRIESQTVLMDGGRVTTEIIPDNN